MTTSILIVEDDRKTAAAVREGLRQEGYEANAAADGEEGLRLLRGGRYDVVILDWMLPRRSGFDVLKAARKEGLRTPVLLLTARDGVEDRVLGLDAGADDYLVKPFAFAELLARLRALLRRGGSPEPLCRQVADLTLDLERREVARAGRSIVLTPREFDLLLYLMRHHDQVVTRHMLARDVWRELQRATPLDNVIDVHIAHLRRKVDGGADCKLIHTLRGVGFILGASHA